MGKGPSDDDAARAERAARAAKSTAAAMTPYVSANRLNPALLKGVLDEFAPGNDAEGDGIYDQTWLSWETFYRHTAEDYVPVEHRLAYRHRLEHAFPGKKGAM